MKAYLQIQRSYQNLEVQGMGLLLTSFSTLQNPYLVLHPSGMVLPSLSTLVDWGSNRTKIFHKPMIETSKSKEASYLAHILWGQPFSNSLIFSSSTSTP